MVGRRGPLPDDGEAEAVQRCCDRFSRQEISIEINNSTNERGIVMADVKPIPEGYHSITPYLIIGGAAEALEYYKKAFGAIELFRMEHEGKIGHAEMKIGDSPFMLSDEHPEMGYQRTKIVGWFTSRHHDLC